MTINFSDFTSTRHEVVAGEAPTQVPRLTRQLAKGAITDGQPILDTEDGNETISLPGPVISSIAEPESVVSISTSSNRTLDISDLDRNEEVHVVFDHSVGNSSGVLKLVKIDEAALQVPFYRDIGTGNTSLATGAFSSNIVQSGLGGQTTYTITAGTNTFTKNALIGGFAVGDILLIDPPTDLTTLSNNKSAVVTQVESTKVTVDRIFESTLTNVAIKKVTFRPEVNKDASLGIIRTDSLGAYSFESFCTSRSNVFGNGTPVDNLIAGPADTNSGDGLANARFTGNIGMGVNFGTFPPDNNLHVRQSRLVGRDLSNANTDLTLEAADNTGIQFFSATQTQLRFGDDSNSGSGAIIYTHADDTLRLSTASAVKFTVGSSEKVRINSSGEVGIGTNDPDSQLHINDAANGNDHQIMFSYQDTNSHSIGRDHATGKFEFTSLINNNGFNFIGAGPNANNSVFAVNTTQLMVNGDNGKVGIGTSSPDALLHISATSPHVDIGPQGGNRGKIGYHDLDVYIGSTSSTGEIHFKNNISSTDSPHSSGDTKMVITDSGVGIGTDTTSNQLHIKSDGSDANGATLRLHHANNNTSDHCATIILANNVGQFAAISGGTSGGNQNGFIAFSTDNAGTNSTKLTIAHDGTFTYPQATSFAVTGDLTIDSSSDIILDADGGEVVLKDGGTSFGHLKGSTSDFIIQALVADKDIIFKGSDSDGESVVTALTLDMSEAGAATFNNNVTAFSDRRLKDNIKTLDATKTYSMRGVSYTRNGRPGSGVIAQELEEVAPELVLTNDKGIKSVDYGRTIGYLIETIKDLNGRLTKTELLLEEALKHNKNNP